ncbi:MAG: hypothetical protein MUE95_04150 [Cyclobacteriaceae bacterium]|jgi:hypothetical protein|nr:hypothetical protein [Cyclobacteriaceae bacterium]
MRMYVSRLFCSTVLLLASLTVYSQPLVSSGFVQDSTKIGTSLHYFLTARYPQELQVLFPDSVYDFSPFEFQRKIYFPTATSNGTSYDSTVYELITFDLEPVQYLSLPVFVVTTGDSVRYNSSQDSIALQLLVKGTVPDSISAEQLPLITRTYYERVRQLFNYPIVLGILAGLLITSIIIWIVFGKRIRKYLTKRRINNRYRAFEQKFADIRAQVVSHFSPDSTERALVLWKEYMEFLEGKPYTKQTTRETILTEQDVKLGECLRALDKAIYGHEKAVNDPLTHLGIVAMQRTEKKMEEVMHG